MSAFETAELQIADQVTGVGRFLVRIERPAAQTGGVAWVQQGRRSVQVNAPRAGEVAWVPVKVHGRTLYDGFGRRVRELTPADVELLAAYDQAQEALWAEYAAAYKLTPVLTNTSTPIVRMPARDVPVAEQERQLLG